MPIIYSGSNRQSNKIEYPTTSGTGGSGLSDVANIGKINLSIVKPGESATNVATGLAGAVQGIGKGIVSFAENLPVVGLVTKPVIGAVGAVADATIGQAVNAVSNTPVGKFVNDAAGAAAGIATAPLDWTLKALTAPINYIGERVAAARVESTIEGKGADLITTIFGYAPESVRGMAKAGMTIDEIAQSMVSQFGTGNQKMGAFSQDGLTNLIWNIALDPFTWFGDYLIKPFTIGAKAAELSATTAAKLVKASEFAITEAVKFEKLGGDANIALAATRRLEAAAALKDAAFIDKWGWTGSIYSATFGKVKNPISKFFGTEISKGISQAWTRVSRVESVNPSLNTLERVLGKDVVDAAMGNLALTMSNASKAAVQDVVVNSRQNLWSAAAETLVKRLHGAITEGVKGADLLGREIASGVTVRELLKDAGMADETITKALSELEKGFHPEAKTFFGGDGVTNVIRELTDVFSKTDVRNNPSLYTKISSYLGESNLKFAMDAAVDLMSKNKLNLQRYADNPVLGGEYLSRMIQYSFGATKEVADEIAAGEFARLAGDSRQLMDVLEFYRSASFGKSMRSIADIRASFPKTFADLPETVARRENIAATFFGALPDQAERSLVAAVYDSMEARAAHDAGVTIGEWYAAKTFGLSGSVVDDTVKLSDELFAAQKDAKALFENATPEQILETAMTITPTQRMKDAGLGGQFKPELVSFPGAERDFALPGGLAELENPRPYNFIDEAIIQGQLANAAMPGDVRVKIYKKIWAGKATDMADPIAVTNRVMFGILSANTGLTPNAAIYALMRVRTADELAAFAANWSERAKSGIKPSELGTMWKEEVLGKGTKKLPTNQEGVVAPLTITEENIGRAVRAMVFANENPAWFTLRPGETLEQFADRLTAIGGVGQKVGTFTAELLNPGAMSRGAIDRHMTAIVYDWAAKQGPDVFNQLIKDISAADRGEEFIAKMAEQLDVAKANGTSLSGASAFDIEAKLGKKGWNKPVPDHILSAMDGVPSYVRNQETTVKIFEGSVAEVMMKYVERIAADRATEFPGLESLSGAQKQWFLWDLQRGNIEPHSWVNNGVEQMVKATPQQIGDASAALGRAAGKTGEPFSGVSPQILAEFYAKNGKQVLGAARFYNDNRAAIQLFKGADITTALHEVGHVARRRLAADQSLILDSIYKTEGKWTVDAEERFANDFVTYLRSGRSPVRELDNVFSQIRDIITQIWEGVTGTKNLKLDPELRKVFDSLFVTNAPSIVKPTEDLWSRITLVSERSMTQNARAQILEKADKILGLTDNSTGVVDDAAALDNTTQFLADNPLLVNEGLSFNPFRKTAVRKFETRGFLVAVNNKFEKLLTGAERSRFASDLAYRTEVLSEYAARFKELLKNDSLYVGVFDDGTNIYIDISKAHASVQDAIEVGVRNKQQSIWSAKNNATLYLDTERGRAAVIASKGVESLTRSAADVANLASLEQSRVLTAETDAAIRALANEAINKYDDVSSVWYNKGGDPLEVIQYIRDHPEVVSRELSKIELENLPAAFAAKQEELALAGYRYGIAPQGGVLERTATVVDNFGRSRLTQVVSPFTDLLDNTAINKLDAAIVNTNKRPTAMDTFIDKLTRKYGSEVTRNNYIERLTADLMGKASLSQRDVMQIVSRVGNLAARKETTVKGLWFEKDQVELIFRQVMGDSEYLKYAANHDPLTDIVSAAAGDVGVVGLTSAFSGRAKAWKPIMGAITDRAYPILRFGKLNPIFYNWLEPIETKMMKAVFDIQTEVVDKMLGETQSTVLRRMMIDNRSVNREIAEGLFYHQEQAAKATLIAVEGAPGLKSQIARTLGLEGTWADFKNAVLNPVERKRIARNATANQLAVEEFWGLLNKTAPQVAKDLAEMGLGDAKSVVARILEDYMVQSSPEAMARALVEGQADSIGLFTNAIAGGGAIPAEKAREIAAAVYGVFQDSMIRATETADRFQYFAQQRSWFERSINHPFLGIYPYSYMTQKAIPAMLTLMFKPKIAGAVRPGLGIVNYMRVREFIHNDVSFNQSFMNEVIKNPVIWYAINIMLPATPENMGFSAPGFVRRGFLQPAAAGQPIDLAQMAKVPGYIGETIMRGTVLGQGASIAQALDVFGTGLDNQIQDFAGSASQDLNRFFTGSGQDLLP